jgi:DNA-binding response OmpR family regulator
MKLDAHRDTILLVDDNLDVRACAKTFLENAGYPVLTAADGEEGFRYYESHRSNIILLLTDVMMPNMNGLELADRVLRLDSKLPVLFMSGDALGVDRGFGCVVKPFKSAELVARVNQVLHAKAPFRDIGRPRLAPAAQNQL